VSLFNLFEVIVEVDERLVLVVLTGDICTKAAEALELLFHFLGGDLDVGLYSSQVLGVVHLCTGISDNLDILREELVSVLL
jgi:hypothetical protein